jgi:hypothetical protein
MLTGAISLIVAALTLQGTAAAPVAKAESAKLQHVYKSGDADLWSFVATLNDAGGGEHLSIEGQVALKTLAEPKDAKVDIEFSMPKLKVSSGGADTGAAAPDAFKTKLDKNGFSGDIEVKDESWIFVLLCVSSYLPSNDVEVGKDFNISASGAEVSISGKGTLSEIVTEEGKKVAVVKLKVNVTPKSDEPGEVSVISRFDLETGKLLRAEGKLTVSEGTATFNVKKVAKPAK